MSSTDNALPRLLEISMRAASFTSGLAESPQLAEPPLTSNVAITLARAGLAGVVVHPVGDARVFQVAQRIAHAVPRDRRGSETS